MSELEEIFLCWGMIVTHKQRSCDSDGGVLTDLNNGRMMDEIQKRSMSSRTMHALMLSGTNNNKREQRRRRIRLRLVQSYSLSTTTTTTFSTIFQAAHDLFLLGGLEKKIFGTHCHRALVEFEFPQLVFKKSSENQNKPFGFSGDSREK